MDKNKYSFKALAPLISIYVLTSVTWYFLITYLNLSVPKNTLQISVLNVALHLSSLAFIYVGINATLFKTHDWFVKFNEWTRK